MKIKKIKQIVAILFLSFSFASISNGALTKDEVSNRGSLTGGGTMLGQGFATNFGHLLNKSDDKKDNGITACGKNTRYNKSNTYTNKKTGKTITLPPDPNNYKYASLPASTLKEMFGSSLCPAFKGKIITVCNKATKKCVDFELQEIGPSEGLKKEGHIVDLTGSGMKLIGGNGKTEVEIFRKTDKIGRTI